jgi:hypothetical protein
MCKRVIAPRNQAYFGTVNLAHRLRFIESLFRGRLNNKKKNRRKDRL